MSSKIRPIKPFVIMMYGFPGAGKTALGRQLSEELGIIHLQQDKIIHDLLGAKKGPNSEKVSRRIMNFMANDYLHAGISIVYDASVTKFSERKTVREIAHANHADSLLVWLQVDPETTFERVRKRDHRKADDRYAVDYSEQDYRDILSQMKNPKNEDYIVVSGKHTFNSQRSQIVKRLLDIGALSSSEAVPGLVKPGLTNLIPKTIQHRGDIIKRNISIR